MSEIIVSNIYSNDTKYSVNLSEVPGNISSINDTDSIKNENNYVTTLEDIDFKEEPLIAVDESDAKIEKKNFTFPNQGSLHVKVSYIVGTLFTYC